MIYIYRFIIKTDRKIGYSGYTHTGTLRASKKYSDKEVEELAKQMLHGAIDSGKLTYSKLLRIEQ